jgi:hypothetical protein
MPGEVWRSKPWNKVNIRTATRCDPRERGARLKFLIFIPEPIQTNSKATRWPFDVERGRRGCYANDYGANGVAVDDIDS